MADTVGGMNQTLLKNKQQNIDFQYFKFTNAKEMKKEYLYVFSRLKVIYQNHCIKKKALSVCDRAFCYLICIGLF
ncbi:hypothetical protein DMB68_06475 [Flavobacterium hydrophilum]|uniref:Uncharacterized protein n=1 Tax=Flavobacterium hydrophilum TaxID=2211445 RepID=A0A2V4C729_9FLAO|nr:hypothetical protein DMB68_06475 [Flavobacterium hydrophilum]